MVFGPEDDFFNKFAALARLVPALPLIGGGHTKFEPVYVGDIANAVAMVAANGGKPARVYELGGPNVYSFRELMEITLPRSAANVCLCRYRFQSLRRRPQSRS